MSRLRATALPATGSLVLALAVALLLFFGKAILIPLAFALTLSLLLAPACALLECRRIPRALAVALVALLTAAGLGLTSYLLSRQVLSIAATVPSYRANMERKIGSLHFASASSLQQAFDTLDQIAGELQPSPALREPAPVTVVPTHRGPLQAAAELAARVLKPLADIFIVLVFTVYMLMNREELRHRILLLSGMARINLMTQALEDATLRISRYLVMQLQVNACFGLFFGIVLAILGVPNAPLWGLLAALLRIIPFVGAAAAMLLPLMLSIATAPTWWQPLFVVVLFFALELTVSNFIEPWVFSSRTGISSLALLVSAIFWTMLWGWPGLVLSTPLTVCVVVLGRHVPQLSFLHSLLGSNAQLSPAAHFYERLLASDQAEAHAIAHRYLEGKPLVSLYDSVLIPALSLAEEHRHEGAMDPIRSNFILLNVREIVARLANYREPGAFAEPRSSRSMALESRHVHPLKEIAVVCIAPHNPIDELTTQMLAQLLELSSIQSITFRPDALSSDILTALAAEPDTILVISSVPPFSYTRVREILKTVRIHLPENRLLLGLWNDPEDAANIPDRFGPAGPDAVADTLRQAMTQITAWQRATRRQ